MTTTKLINEFKEDLDSKIRDIIEKDKIINIIKKDLLCKQCEYKCKLKSTLKKHMNTKHGATK